MGWGPLTPAEVAFDATTGLPAAPRFGDIYHPLAGALAQARHVFLHGNGLPGRWAGRERFVVLETGFGLGHNFLATWAAWRSGSAAQRCRRLWFLSLDAHPALRSDLQRAHAESPHPALAEALLRAWPPATPDIHLLDFDGGQVRLLLALGDVARVMPQWVAQVDAFYLDGFAPARNPQMWSATALKALPRLAAPQATLATWSVARELRDTLSAQGWQVSKAQGSGGKREITVAQFAPRVAMRRPPGREAMAPRSVLVVGAGLAGALTARALRREGVDCTVLDAAPGAAQAASGNPAGLFHGVVHGDDGHHARWLRACALHAATLVSQAGLEAGVQGSSTGLMRLAPGRDVMDLQTQIDAQALPPAFVRAVDAAQASDLVGLPLAHGGLWFGEGGWVAPAEMVGWALAGLPLRCGAAVARLQQTDRLWQALDEHGHLLAEAEAVVLANGADAARLLPAHAAALPAWQRWRGQLTLLAGASQTPKLPVTGSGYALALPDGPLLCGATRQLDDDDPRLREADHQHNLDQLAQWMPGAAGLVACGGRVAWRMSTADRLPLLGPVALAPAAPGQITQPRRLPRLPGLYLHTALGSRGIAQAALGAQVLASWISGAPVPLASQLMDAVDPGRAIT